MATINWVFLPQNILIHQQNNSLDGSALKHFKLPDDKNALEGTFMAKVMHCTSEIKGSDYVTYLRVSTVSEIYFF